MSGVERKLTVFNSGSLSLGRLFGIPFQLHWSVLLVALLFGSGLVGQYGPLGAAFALVAFLASITAHELAHALVARRHGVQTISIQLWALGGAARLDREAPTPGGEAWIAAAGPLTSLGIGGASLGAAFGLDALGVDGVGLSILAWLGVINLVLGVFNLLPGAPLDGGRILRAARWRRHGDRFRAAREACNAGKAVGWSIAAIGAVMLVQGRPGLMLVLTGAFIAINAKAEATDPGACVKNYCTTTGLDAIERARSFANAGQWVGIGGILVAAVGVTLVLTSSSGRATPARPTTSLSVAPWAGPGTAGLSLGGLW